MRFVVTSVCVLLAGMVSLQAAEHEQLKAFPPAKEGMVRHVIVLPHKERGDDQNFSVELIAGKTMLTDGVNRMRLGYSIESRPLKGWGYTYYDVTGKGMAAGTLIAPPPGGKKVEAFVGGAPLKIRYNSRLPVVVYAPEGVEVRYRIWSAEAGWTPADKG